MPDLSGRELLNEWRKGMDAVLASAASVGGETVSRQLLEPMQRQLELVQELIERERRVQSQLAAQLFSPSDAVFGLLEESGVMLRRQAEALQAAGRALDETGRLVKTQAELFERAIGVLREPAERAKMVLGVERHTGTSSTRKSRRRGRSPG